MKTELQQKLYDEFPGWFDYLDFGIEVGDGWFDLLHETCIKLKEVGFNGKFSQIKEKYGSLRVYIAKGATEEQWKIVEDAEEKSEFICEQCGEDGKLVDDGWIYGICEPCYKKLKKTKY